MYYVILLIKSFCFTTFGSVLFFFYLSFTRIEVEDAHNLARENISQGKLQGDGSTTYKTSSNQIPHTDLSAIRLLGCSYLHMDWLR